MFAGMKVRFPLALGRLDVRQAGQFGQDGRLVSENQGLLRQPGENSVDADQMGGDHLTFAVAGYGQLNVALDHIQEQDSTLVLVVQQLERLAECGLLVSVQRVPQRPARTDQPR